MLNVTLTMNGCEETVAVSPRDTLSDLVRNRLDLTGTHVGCDHGACGACTVELDGMPVRSCIVLAASCTGRSVRTIEGTRGDPVMNVIRRHFHEQHALQCGFCTPGMLMLAADIVRRLPDPNADQIRGALSGQVCRCTGYMGIVAAIASAAAELNGTRRSS